MQGREKLGTCLPPSTNTQPHTLTGTRQPLPRGLQASLPSGSPPQTSPRWPGPLNPVLLFSQERAESSLLYMAQAWIHQPAPLDIPMLSGESWPPPSTDAISQQLPRATPIPCTHPHAHMQTHTVTITQASQGLPTLFRPSSLPSALPDDPTQTRVDSSHSFVEAKEKEDRKTKSFSKEQTSDRNRMDWSTGFQFQFCQNLLCDLDKPNSIPGLFILATCPLN